MSAVHELHVDALAHRIGLRLRRVSTGGGEPLYQLVEPSSMTPVLPAGGAEGARLHDLEDWLHFPWE
jgi:hypothetical protein